jgi:hypothetical protein
VGAVQWGEHEELKELFATYCGRVSARGPHSAPSDRGFLTLFQPGGRRQSGAPAAAATRERLAASCGANARAEPPRGARRPGRVPARPLVSHPAPLRPTLFPGGGRRQEGGAGRPVRPGPL